MPRYIDIETITFTDYNGDDVPVKGIRPLGDEEVGTTVFVTEGMLIDEIASRSSVYGDDGEDQSYRIFDRNATRLVEARFSLGKVRELKVPL